MPHVVDCPSKLVVSVREFQVSDEDLLADPRSIRDGLVTTRLLEAITVSFEDPGPYTPKKDGLVSWDDVLQGDRMEVLRSTRIKTRGPELDYRIPCPNCRQPVEETIDLSELPVRPLPETSVDHVAKGTPIRVRLPVCGTVVGFKLLRGRDDKGLAAIQKQHAHTRSSTYLRFRMLEVEGVKQPDWTSWIQNLSTEDAAFLRAAYDEHDCGVDQERDFTCGSCGHVWLEDVRFGADFLFPKYRKRKSGGTTSSPSSRTSPGEPASP